MKCVFKERIKATNDVTLFGVVSFPCREAGLTTWTESVDRDGLKYMNQGVVGPDGVLQYSQRHRKI